MTKSFSRTHKVGCSMTNIFRARALRYCGAYWIVVDDLPRNANLYSVREIDDVENVKCPKSKAGFFEIDMGLCKTRRTKKARSFDCLDLLGKILY